jgi:hypothetical protein
VVPSYDVGICLSPEDLQSFFTSLLRTLSALTALGLLGHLVALHKRLGTSSLHRESEVFQNKLIPIGAREQGV